MIKRKLYEILESCFQEGCSRGLWTDAAAGRYGVEVPKHEGQGDYATNMALVIGGVERRNPRQVAAALAEMLESRREVFRRVEVAGPGFVNLFLDPAVYQQVLPAVLHAGDRFGVEDLGRGRRVLVEFVSANPTGPLSIGHGRNGVLGDAVARLLQRFGYDVTREYYFNDAGRQMRVLAESLRARYLELLGEAHEFPEDGYQGEYLYDIARDLVEAHGRDKIDAPLSFFKERAQEAIFANIEATLARLGIAFDSYYNEHSLYEQGFVEEVIGLLRDQGLVYEQDGATWFKTTALGLEQDRVIVKSTGEPTYRLPDIAYHREKFRRGFDWMIDIFGADHIATVPDVLAGVRALGYDPDKVTGILHQFVTLLRDGRQVKMSTRKATFVTVDELLDEVGPDALRFFFLMRKPDAPLEFDLELAKKESQENPVYYVQYAHARLCALERQAQEKGVVLPEPPPTELYDRLDGEEELAILKLLGAYPSLVQGAVRDLAPHRVIYYLIDLAGRFHGFYNRHRILGDDRSQTWARMLLCRGVRQVVAAGLSLLGIRAPERM